MLPQHIRYYRSNARVPTGLGIRTPYAGALTTGVPGGAAPPGLQNTPFGTLKFRIIFNISPMVQALPDLAQAPSCTSSLNFRGDSPVFMGAKLIFTVFFIPINFHQS